MEGGDQRHDRTRRVLIKGSTPVTQKMCNYLLHNSPVSHLVGNPGSQKKRIRTEILFYSSVGAISSSACTGNMKETEQRSIFADRSDYQMRIVGMALICYNGDSTKRR